MIFMLCIHVVYILVAQSRQHTYLYLNFCVIFWKKFDGSLVEVADSAYKLNHSGHEFTSSSTKEPAACKYHNQHHNRRQIMDRRTPCAARTGQDECGVKFERRFTTKLIALEQHEKLKSFVGVGSNSSWWFVLWSLWSGDHSSWITYPKENCFQIMIYPDKWSWRYLYTQ